MEESLRERLADWIATAGRRQLVALATVAAVAVGGAVFWYLRALPRPVAVAALPAAAPDASASPAAIFVHVAGWVRSPGVYEFVEGDRVIDAIERAGGPKEGADLAGLNLAALLTDAQQVLVPRRAPPGGGPVGPAGSAAANGPGASALVNVNTATLEELETLPGIGPVLAQAILDYREENGPFRSVDDLMNVSGIGEKRLADLRDKVTV